MTRPIDQVRFYRLAPKEQRAQRCQPGASAVAKLARIIPPGEQPENAVVFSWRMLRRLISTPKEGVTYTGLWFNAAGLNRALVFRNKLTITGSISLTASEGFTQKNLHRSHADGVSRLGAKTKERSVRRLYP